MTRGVPRPPKTPAPLDSQYVGVKLPDTLVHGLDRIARRDTVTRAELLRKVVAEFVEREEHV